MKDRFGNIFLEGHLFDMTVAAMSIRQAKSQPMVIVNTLICEGKSPSWIQKCRKQINTVCSILQLHPLLSSQLLHQHCHTASHAAAYSPIIVRNPSTHQSTPDIIKCSWVACDDMSILIILLNGGTDLGTFSWRDTCSTQPWQLYPSDSQKPNQW